MKKFRPRTLALLIMFFLLAREATANDHSIETSWEQDAHVLPWSPGEGSHSFKVSREESERIEEASRVRLREFFESFGHETEFSFEVLRKVGHYTITSAQELPPQK